MSAFDSVLKSVKQWEPEPSPEVPLAFRSRPTAIARDESASNCVQNRAFYRQISGMEASKANCINRSYGAGDGNRTHVRSLGSFYTAIVRRPLFSNRLSIYNPLEPVQPSVVPKFQSK